jgi:predicted TIM-barrel fold metal-dependent hydrolase
MNANGIQRSVVLRGRAMDHEGLVAASLDWPGRLYPFVSISPEHREYRGSWESGSSAIVELADSLLSTGSFYGVGEISAVHFPGPGFPEADYSPTGGVMHGIFEVARRHDVPVTVHIEVTRLAELESMLAEYRDVEVIWAHGGYTQLFLAERMLTRHPNLTYELSARTWRRHPRSPDYTILRDGAEVWGEWLSLIERMPDRFLVGTDASLRSAASDQEKIGSVENLLSQLTEGTRRRVAYGNLERLLNLPN